MLLIVIIKMLLISWGERRKPSDGFFPYPNHKRFGDFFQAETLPLKQTVALYACVIYLN